MKFKTIAGSTLALIFGCSITTYAYSYFPPERITCSSSKTKSVDCEGFNHNYLVEEMSSGVISNHSETFYFSSGAAYFSSDMKEASIFFTYKNCNGKRIWLKSANTAIKPDFSAGNWYKFSEDLYKCKAGYMNCPITNLPY